MDVLLRNRGELGLTDAQVLRLEALDEQRETQVAALQARLAERKKAAESASGDRPADIGTGNGRGGGAGAGTSRGMASTAGPGTRGGGRAPPLTGRKDDELSRLRQRMDDADTRAYVDAVTQVLTEAQRERAEKLASAYREALFDYREALRRRGGPLEE